MSSWTYIFLITFTVTIASARPTFDKIADLLLDIADEGRTYSRQQQYKHPQTYAQHSGHLHNQPYPNSYQSHAYPYPPNVHPQRYDNYGQGYLPQPQYRVGYGNQQYDLGTIRTDPYLRDDVAYQRQNVLPTYGVPSNSVYNGNQYGSQYPYERPYENSYGGRIRVQQIQQPHYPPQRGYTVKGTIEY